jgi:phosphatidylserine decarboxylase
MAAADSSHPVIAREGWALLAAAAVIALALSWARWWPFAALAWLAVVFIAQFFRDPARVAPAQPNTVLSAADGKVVLDERARQPNLERDADNISVFINVININ